MVIKISQKRKAGDKMTVSNAKYISPKKYVFLYLIFAVVFSLVLFLMMFFSMKSEKIPDTDTLVTENNAHAKRPIVVIDAGHGGEDGGAVGKNGIYEKDLNLMIASDLCDMLRANGIEVVMTRKSDIMLYDRQADYKGRKKMLDLAARVKIAEEYEDCIFVSIHMNSFPQEKYRGLQVYYSGNSSLSMGLADEIQSSVCNYIQKENTRQTKKASTNIYLLDRIKSPAVLIECGFLSNPDECSLLCTEEYRQKLTMAIFCGICRHISENNS